MNIDGFEIGLGNTFIIAEIGSNHGQDLQLAYDSIAAAKQCGANAVKFQSLNLDALYHDPSEEIRKLYKRIDLNEQWHYLLKEYCDDVGITFFSTPTYLKSVDILEDIDVSLYKIASAQAGTFPQLVDKVAQLQKPTLFSCGITRADEVESVVRIFKRHKNDQYIILHCNSIYPTPNDKVNLRLMDSYRKQFGDRVGFSDHTSDIYIPIAAVALGALVIEKHFALDKSLPVPDAIFSLEPDQFSRMVEGIRATEKSLGSGVRKQLEEEEQSFKDKILYRLELAIDKNVGEVFKESDFDYKRNPKGIDCRNVDQVLGKTAKNKLLKGNLLQWEDIDPMTEKKVLIINLGWEQEPLIHHMVAQGYNLYGVHYDENYCREVTYQDVLISDIRDLDRILSFAEDVQPDAVISDQCDYSHFAQAVVAEKFNLPGPGVQQAQVSANKYFQRLLAEKHGLKIPVFELTYSVEQLKAFADRQGYPVIIKPLDNRGSIGVFKIESSDEIEKYFFDALAQSHSRLLIAEEFIFGHEITIDGYCFDGLPISLALASKQHVSEKTQVSIDIKYPGELPGDIYEAALENNVAVAKALGYTFGMVHSEYLVTDQQEIYLVESANRGGGVYTSEIVVPAVSGIDLVQQYANDAMGIERSPAPISIEKNNVIIKFFTFDKGRIKDIIVPENTRTDDALLKFMLLVKIGDEIKPITSDANRHGFVIVQAALNVREKAQDLINSIEIVYE